MQNQFARTEMLFGSEAMEKLKNAKVAVFGVGGVGGYVVEALVRSGVGSLVIVDKDEVSLTNLNRQIIATHDSIGKPKVWVMKDRILSINPECLVEARECFYLPENKDTFDFREYSYVVDAVDTVTAKISLIMQAEEAGVPIISSMGTGNKFNPMGFEVADISKTSVCPLAKVMRKELKDRGITHVPVVYSKEVPTTPIGMAEALSEEDGPKRSVPASNAFVPSAAGLLIASHVIKELTK